METVTIKAFCEKLVTAGQQIDPVLAEVPSDWRAGTQGTCLSEGCYCNPNQRVVVVRNDRDMHLRHFEAKIRPIEQKPS